MWLDKTPLKFINEYLNNLQECLKAEGNYHLSLTQKTWIGICLMGILLTNSISWAKFERMTFKTYTKQALSWVFRKSKISWDRLLIASVKMVLKKYDIKDGILVIDDKDINRSKNAKKLFRLHKIKDKKTGGYITGQNIVLIYFVSKKISLPVSFAFYSPDPKLKEWNKQIKDYKKKKIAKIHRPSKPERSKDHPKKYELAIELLSSFKRSFPKIKITAILADCLYGHFPFVSKVEDICPSVQLITKMRKKQKIVYGNKKYSCESYTNSYKGWEQKIKIRGREEVKVLAGGGRLYVSSHKAKRFVIGLKYEGEKEYRYLLATNLSWDMKMIMEVFTARWLIEVFFEDWSCYNGFCSLAKQCGEEGSLRPLTLSLLFDHCFFYHEDQFSSLKNGCPLATFGTLLEKSRVTALCQFIQKILEDESPKEKLQELVNGLDKVYPLRVSKKHFNGVDFDLEPRIEHVA